MRKLWINVWDHIYLKTIDYLKQMKLKCTTGLKKYKSKIYNHNSTKSIRYISTIILLQDSQIVYKQLIY